MTIIIWTFDDGTSFGHQGPLIYMADVGAGTALLGMQNNGDLIGARAWFRGLSQE